MTDHDNARMSAAAFLAEALALPDPPAALASDLLPIDDDGTVAVFAADLDSSVGPAAFLVYVYAIATIDEEGRAGRDRFEADLAVLHDAAARDAPGPRLVAQALSEAAGFLLATTPATVRALAGESATGPPDPIASPPHGGELPRARAAAAAELLRLLRAADGEATVWLNARGAATGADAFLPEETALALFLLDDRSIRSLLSVLDRVLAAARENAASALGDRT